MVTHEEIKRKRARGQLGLNDVAYSYLYRCKKKMYVHSAITKKEMSIERGRNRSICKLSDWQEEMIKTKESRRKIILSYTIKLFSGISTRHTTQETKYIDIQYIWLHIEQNHLNLGVILASPGLRISQFSPLNSIPSQAEYVQWMGHSLHGLSRCLSFLLQIKY